MGSPLILTHSSWLSGLKKQHLLHKSRLQYFLEPELVPVLLGIHAIIKENGDIPDRDWHLIHNMPVLLAPNLLTPDQSNPATRTACLPSGYPIGSVKGGQAVMVVTYVLYYSSPTWFVVTITLLYTQLGLHFERPWVLHKELYKNVENQMKLNSFKETACKISPQHIICFFRHTCHMAFQMKAHSPFLDRIKSNNFQFWWQTWDFSEAQNQWKSRKKNLWKTSATSSSCTGTKTPALVTKQYVPSDSAAKLTVFPDGNVQIS